MCTDLVYSTWISNLKFLASFRKKLCVFRGNYGCDKFYWKKMPANLNKLKFWCVDGTKYTLSSKFENSAFILWKSTYLLWWTSLTSLQYSRALSLKLSRKQPTDDDQNKDGEITIVQAYFGIMRNEPIIDYVCEWTKLLPSFQQQYEINARWQGPHSSNALRGARLTSEIAHMVLLRWTTLFLRKSLSHWTTYVKVVYALGLKMFYPKKSNFFIQQWYPQNKNKF